MKKKELSVLSNLLADYRFLSTFFLTAIIQILVVQFGGASFRLAPLTPEQHFVCILVGATGILWNASSKSLIPESILNYFSLLK